jgi:Fe-S-cluster containining protein
MGGNAYIMTETSRHTLDRFFSGTVDYKMHAMDKLYNRHGRQLLADETITVSLALLKEYAAELSAYMQAMSLGPLCSNCASRTGGGCCSSYMEANSDVVLLLINRLYGINVTRQHDDSTDCCFLGHSGCILPIKPMFCLNYNCKHISDQATKKEMDDLEQLAGRLLTEQTRLESILLHNL